MGVFGPGQLLTPGLGIMGHQVVKHTTENLVSAFSLPISLWVKP